MWPSDMDFPGTFTDMFVRPPATQYSRDDEFIAYMTPTRPDFWWGAYLVSRGMVTKTNLASVLSEWEIRLGALTDIKKKIIQWEVPVSTFSTASMEWISELNEPPESISINSVLVANALTMPLPAPIPDMTLEEASCERDFVEIVNMALADLESTPESSATEGFLRWKHDQFNERVKNGSGSWWMLKYKGEFVANCGLLSNGKTARFREVTTHPRWRRQGFAQKLCQRVLAEGFNDPAIDHIVIVAEHNSSAERIYTSIGFNLHSFQFALMWDLK